LKEILHHLHDVGASGWADDSRSFSNLGAET
jgi:hypothetical protein